LQAALNRCFPLIYAVLADLRCPQMLAKNTLLGRLWGALAAARLPRPERRCGARAQRSPVVLLLGAVSNVLGDLVGLLVVGLDRLALEPAVGGGVALRLAIGLASRYLPTSQFPGRETQAAGGARSTSQVMAAIT
jgi:hypothetical protein